MRQTYHLKIRSQEDFYHYYQHYKAALFWCRFGFDLTTCQDLLLLGLDPREHQIGSKTFRYFWSKTKTWTAKERLQFFLDVLEMPDELSGRLEENRELVARFDPSLAPHDRLFLDLADLVDKAFPKRSLALEGRLERRIHQLRYVLSSQQAEFVRCHYQKEGMSDALALARYLKTLPRKRYAFRHSSRLHNKKRFNKGSWSFPEGKESYNIKILIDFHTEFILSSCGYFLNEVDARVLREAGIVNGASFNYGNVGARHWDLDVTTIRPHDPMFRNRIARAYRAPNTTYFPLSKDYHKKYPNSQFSHTGAFSTEGKSLYYKLKQAKTAFKRLLKNV
ncbi:DUF3114 domain-containing protein [Streptococcus sp. zg-JUN1979]|uniref:DUF3114 domain-containing protein n=1 Tax=Streptococcus sp. zg-JUN1979 TaxID=3391450 RepID=UPI0039A40003